MASEKTINISLKESEFSDAIAKVITGPNKDLVTECLFAVLDSISGDMRQNFFKATMGIKPVAEFQKGEQVLVIAERVGDWNFDKAAMETAGLTKDGKLTARIIEVNPWKDNKYRLKYDYIHTDGRNMTDTYTVNGHNLELAEEFPEDLI